MASFGMFCPLYESLDELAMDRLAMIDGMEGFLFRIGRWSEAYEMQVFHLRKTEKLLGKEHPSTLGSMNNLALVLSKQGKYDEAEEMHRQALALRERMLGKEHPYASFFAEARAKQGIHKQTRQSGESNSNKAHKEYLAHIYADRTPKDYERVKQALKKDLRHRRRWSILVDRFVADNEDSIPGLGLGLLLLCGPAVAKKKGHMPIHARRIC